MTVTGLLGAQYQLDPNVLGDGGEGKIHRVLGGLDKKVAKIYNQGVISRELVEKLGLMMINPPPESVLTQVAWPLDMIFDKANQPCGFLMPELYINTELGDIYKYNPGDPVRTLPISAEQKVMIAMNICAVISAVHDLGYVFGDFNPRNIGIDKNTGKVAFLDTDSYHVSDKEKNKVFRCNVCAPGYAAPELLERCAGYLALNPDDKNSAYAKTPLRTFTKDTDCFALAIHIFKLLMNGFNPFGGIIDAVSASQGSPGVGDAAVRRDSYCFKPGYKHQSAAILPLDAFPRRIAELFTRAFIRGKADPGQRPSAHEWHGALEEYRQSLRGCPQNPLHQYYRNNETCPYCEADKRFMERNKGAAAPAPPVQSPLVQQTYTAIKVPASAPAAQHAQNPSLRQPGAGPAQMPRPKPPPIGASPPSQGTPPPSPTARQGRGTGVRDFFLSFAATIIALALILGALWLFTDVLPWSYSGGSRQNDAVTDSEPVSGAEDAVPS